MLKRLGSKIFVCLLLFISPLVVLSEQKTANIANQNQELQLNVLIKSLENSIQAEKTIKEELNVELNNTDIVKEALVTKSKAYKVQYTTLSNILYLPSPQLRTVENANNSLLTSLKEIQNQFNSIKEKLQVFREQELAAIEQQELIFKQRNEYRTEKGNRKLINLTLNTSWTLQKLVQAKQRSLKKLQKDYSVYIQELERLKDSFLSLSNEYKKKLSKQKSSYLLIADPNPFSRSWPNYFNNLKIGLIEQAKFLLSAGYWNNQINFLRNLDGYDLSLFAFLLTIITWVVNKIKKYSNILRRHIKINTYPTISLSWNLLNKNLRLITITAFFYAYIQLEYFLSIANLIRVITDIMLIWLVSDWCIDLLLLWKPRANNVKENLKPKLLRITQFIRWYFLFTLILAWMFQYNKAYLIISRFVFEISLLIACSYFWKDLRLKHPRKYKKETFVIYMGYISSYIIAVTGISMELFGYGSFASYWYLSWGSTLAIVLWTMLILKGLRELKKGLETVKDNEEGKELEIKNIASYQIRWFSIRLLQLICPLLFVFFILLAWGGKQAILSNMYKAISYQFISGNMSFSILSLIYAILILFATHVVTKLWRNIFNNKFLNQSLIDPGLQESVTTISVYVIWVFGILVSMNVFGLNPTSLIVVFGALGIGLGFGLQNIFNNFMSGLILLLERPIQVGDDIEINGTWAIVKKINVRSTLVQTYDNASLIIPNSDLINTKVTNWSFKDKRLRRTITVGVAYGSNVTLVRELLLDIAQNSPKVLKNPKPDIVFTDFGDSALIFDLRVWTHIVSIFIVETAIRCEIDRRFKEAGITIAFPQRDVYLHHVKAKAKPAPEIKNEDEYM